jgi:hypothetical protein
MDRGSNAADVTRLTVLLLAPSKLPKAVADREHAGTLAAGMTRMRSRLIWMSR